MNAVRAGGDTLRSTSALSLLFKIDADALQVGQLALERGRNALVAAGHAREQRCQRCSKTQPMASTLRVVLVLLEVKADGLNEVVHLAVACTTQLRRGRLAAIHLLSQVLDLSALRRNVLESNLRGLVHLAQLLLELLDFLLQGFDSLTVALVRRRR